MRIIKMSFYKKRKQDYVKKEKDVLKDFQAQKFYLMLYFNDYAFEWQLTKQLNLTKKQIQTYSEELNKKGLISFRLLSELSDNMQEAIMKLTPDFSKIYRQNPKVFIITPEGKLQGKEKLSDFIKEAKENQGIYDLIKQLKVYSESFRIIKKQIMKEEKEILPKPILNKTTGKTGRLVKYPDGTIIEQYNDAYKQLLIELKVNQKETALVPVDKINKDLIALEVDEELKTKRDEYQGLYKHLTQIERDNLNQEVPDKETFKTPLGQRFKINKQEEKHYKSRVEMLEKESYKEVLLMQGAKININDAKKLESEAEDFLNRLGGIK